MDGWGMVLDLLFSRYFYINFEVVFMALDSHDRRGICILHASAW